jgi:hypothetical protein
MHTVVHELRSPLDRPMALWIEPWGDQLVLPAGAVAELRASGPEGGDLEMVPEEGDLTVFAWPGSTLQVFASGSLLCDFSNPVPSVPPGMSVRGFLGLMLGSGS